MMRTVILHFHLFKNAGTSVDQVLRRNFGERWVTAEFPTDTDDNSAAVADWIRAHPQAVAFSTHTALGPVPEIEGVRVVSLMMLRDPIARVRSAYRFERLQEADTWGAELAKVHDLDGYVRARLARRGDRQCRNFQTHRLASLVPGDAPELDRAVKGLSQLSVVGLVEDFDGAMVRLANSVRGAFPDFSWQSVQANRSAPGAPSVQDSAVDAVLRAANGDDLALVDAAKTLLDRAA
jgi:hypothetical protein